MTKPNGLHRGSLEDGTCISTVRFMDFRGFKNREFRFTSGFNVLIGDNGTGKTSVLEGLAIGLGAFVRSMDQKYLRRYVDHGGERGQSPVYGVREHDVRRRVFVKNGVVIAEPQLPASIELESELAGTACEWKRYSKADEDVTEESPEQFKQVVEGIPFTHVLEPRSLTNVLGKLKKNLANGGDGILPLIGYYPAGRLYRRVGRTPVEPVAPSSRAESGYSWCLDTRTGQEDLNRWFMRTEVLALQQRQGDSDGAKLSRHLVRSAVEKCIPDWTNVRYDLDLSELLADSTKSEPRPVRLLSDGLRSMVAIVADLARRAVALNPQLGERAIEDTPGIVLIDELDLHLHPRWQRHVVNDLRSTFPRCQFICTTHSPFIIQQLHPGELIDLNKHKGNEYEGRSIEDITEFVMGVKLPQMSARRTDMLRAAREYLMALRDGSKTTAEERDALRARLDELKAPFSDDPAFVAVLEMERAAAGLGKSRATPPEGPRPRAKRRGPTSTHPTKKRRKRNG